MGPETLHSNTLPGRAIAAGRGEWLALVQMSVTFSCQGPDRKSLRFCRPRGKMDLPGYFYNKRENESRKFFIDGIQNKIMIIEYSFVLFLFLFGWLVGYAGLLMKSLKFFFGKDNTSFNWGSKSVLPIIKSIANVDP